jgi:hypothetical protein
MTYHQVCNQSNILEHLISTHVHDTRSLVFCVVFFRSLFVTLSLFCWLLCCLFSFDLRIMITPLVSSSSTFNSLYIKRNLDMFCFFWFVFSLFIYLFIYCQWLATDRRFSPGTLVSSPNNIDRYEITEILLKVALNPITPYPYNLLHYCIRINQDVFYWCIRQFTLYNHQYEIMSECYTIIY